MEFQGNSIITFHAMHLIHKLLHNLNEISTISVFDLNSLIKKTIKIRSWVRYLGVAFKTPPDLSLG